MKKEIKLKYISELLSTALKWKHYDGDVVSNFIKEAKFKIEKIKGSGNKYIKEIDVFSNGEKSYSFGMVGDWQERITTVLKKLHFEIENEEEMAKQNKVISIHCNKCNHQAKHSVILEHSERETSQELHGTMLLDFWADQYVQILKCGSCGEYTLRKYDISSEDIPDSVECNIIILPKRGNPDIKSSEAFQGVPIHILEIYKETVDAFINETNLLCAGGIRAILEAVCIDKNIKDGLVGEKRTKSLQGRIYGLNEKGLITMNHSNILVHHQYLGNKALHELEKPSSDELKIAIEIIAHTLSSIYELNSKGQELKNKKEERVKS